MDRYVKIPSLAVVVLCSLVSPFAAFAEKDASQAAAPDTVRIERPAREQAGETILVPNSREAKGTEAGAVSEKPASAPEVSTEEPLTAPAGRVRHKGKIITGSALFGVSYGLALYLAYSMTSNDGYVSTSTREQAGYLSIPVAGPMILYFQEQPPSDVALPIMLLCAGWSFAQGMGIALFIRGMVGSAPVPRVWVPPVIIEPVVMADRPGLGLRLRF